MDELEDAISWVKVGLQLFTAEGPSIVSAMKERRLKVFLDLKLHDIPNTTREACVPPWASALRWRRSTSLAEAAMVRSAIEAAAGSPLLVLGVTVLTSMDEPNCAEIGVLRTPEQQVIGLVALGQGCGLRGVVCSR